MLPHFPLPRLQIHLLRLLSVQRRCSVPASSATMVKENTAALEGAKKAPAKAKGRATSRGGSSSRSCLPQGWIQGDRICSTITQKDLDDLANEGLIERGAARLPGTEWQPQTQEGECVS